MKYKCPTEYECTCKEIDKKEYKSSDSSIVSLTEITYEINRDCERHGMPALYRMLAECYRLSGADPDGNEDWRLASRAVNEVRRMRAELDEAEREINSLHEEAAREDL